MGLVGATKLLIPDKSPVDLHALYLASNQNIFQIGGPTGLVTQPSMPVPLSWAPINLVPMLAPLLDDFGYTPDEVTAIDLVGELIITSGTNGGDLGVAVAFQAPGAGINPGRYVGHAACQGLGSGARTDAFARVPVINCAFDMSWLRGDGNEWPNHPIAPYPTGAAYGFNINVQGIWV